MRHPQSLSHRIRAPLPLLLGAAGAVFLAQAIGLFFGAATLAKAKAQLAAKAQHLAQLVHSTPAPTQATADALAAERAELRTEIQDAASRWSANPLTHALSDAPPPANRRAAYFDLARYRQDLAALAHAHGVATGQDAAFGFRAYANEGPEEADIPSVTTQRIALQHILEPLLRARPDALLAVIRDASPEGGTGATAAPTASAQQRDVLAAARHRFQIRFRGTTTALRDWLNALVNARLPLLVHAVSVEPYAEKQIVPAAAQTSPQVTSPQAPLRVATEAGFAPLARPASSDFSITLEYVALASGNEAEAITQNGSPAPRANALSADTRDTWPAPTAQPRGPQWIFELFTPPEIFYHPTRQEFRAKTPEAALASTPAAGAAAAHDNDTAARHWSDALLLLDIRHAPYPLQLSGYLSGKTPNDLWGIFENHETGETLLLREGQRVDALGVELIGFRVESVGGDFAQDMTLRETRAAAAIRSTRGAASGAPRTLYQGVTAEGDTLLALIEVEGTPHELRENETTTLADGARLTIENIHAAPTAQVVVSRQLPAASRGGPSSTASPAPPEEIVLSLAPPSDEPAALPGH